MIREIEFIILYDFSFCTLSVFFTRNFFYEQRFNANFVYIGTVGIVVTAHVFLFFSELC